MVSICGDGTGSPIAYAAAWQHIRGRLDTFTAATLTPKTELEFEAAAACLHCREVRGYEQNSVLADYTVTPPRPLSPPALTNSSRT